MFWMKNHFPFHFPYWKFVKILLQMLVTVFCFGTGFLCNAYIVVVCKQSHCGLQTDCYCLSFKSNWKIIERSIFDSHSTHIHDGLLSCLGKVISMKSDGVSHSTHIHDGLPSCLGKVISMKSDGVKLVIWAQISSLNETMRLFKSFPHVSNNTEINIHLYSEQMFKVPMSYLVPGILFIYIYIFSFKKR